MNWIYAGAALLIAYFTWRGCSGTRQMKRNEKGIDRRQASDLYDLKQLEVQGYLPIDEHERLVGGGTGKEWLN